MNGIGYKIKKTILYILLILLSVVYVSIFINDCQRNTKRI